MNPTTFIAWTVLGLISGTIAKAIYPGSQGGGIVGTIVLGIIGSFIGGTIFTFFNTGSLQIVSTGAVFNIPSLFVAVIGSIVTIFLWTLITNRD